MTNDEWRRSTSAFGIRHSALTAGAAGHVPSVNPSCGRGPRSLVVLLVHPSPEQPASQRTQPAEDVVHVAEVHQFDQVPIEVAAEEEGVAARGTFGAADTLDPFRLQVVV